MRPQRLALSAFGPFAGEQSFDFADLGAHRLFLIHGPTGAGKTTLLDALCFALFGTASGIERQPAHLRSQHAAAATPTWVELDFAIGPDRYRIRRSPAQAAEGRSGRVVTTAPKVILWRQTEDGLVVLAEQAGRARDEIERILGYSDAEFRQVVMLPQGQFREVLTARPDVRQAILATLFRTGLYRRIEEQIALRARAALDEARQLEERRRTLLSEAAATTPEEAAAQVAELAAQHAAARDGVVPLRLAAELAASHLVQGQQAALLLDTKATTAARLGELQHRLPEMRTERDRLAAARRAAATVPTERLHAEAERQADRARKAAATAATQLGEAQSRLERARRALADEPATVLRIEAARTEAARLNAGAQAARLAEDAEARATELEQRAVAARKAVAVAEAAVQGAQSGVDVAVQAATDAARLADTAAWTRDALAHAQVLVADLRSAGELAAKLTKLAKSHGMAREDLEAAARAMAAAGAARQAAEAAVRAYHAAFLARDLRAGVPCAVCGSLDHPQPWAGSPDAAEPFDAEGAALEESAARSRHDVAREKDRQLHDEMLRTGDQLAALRERLPENVDVAEADRRLDVARAASGAAEKAATQAPSFAAAVAAAGQARQAALLAAQDAHAERVRQDGVLATLQGEIRARRADSPAAAGTGATLARAAAGLAARLRIEVAKLDADRTEQAAAEAALQAVRQRAADEAMRAAEATAASGHALAAFGSACRDAGFADPDAARAAHLPPERIGDLAAVLEKFDRDVAQAEALARQAADAAGEMLPPDLPALLAAARNARDAADAAAEIAAQTAERHAQAAVRLGSIQEAERGLDAARARHERLRDLAEGTAGKNDRRLSLEGFVLASILDEALAAANQHLSKMLGGRYRLQRREEPARANAAVGLDIEVLDDWTGLVRPAGTLSGGEGFCAALALALGLADTVQAHAGARRIDTLFIDEGFGSLDEDALDTAMDVLTGLQAGDRLVGIISHVAELRTRIPAQLVVRPGPRGSVAGFVS